MKLLVDLSKTEWAGELAEAGGNHKHAFAACERELRDYVQGSRELGRRSARVLMSMGRIQVGGHPGRAATDLNA